MNSNQYFAHSKNDAGTQHLLSEHLSRVASITRNYLSGWEGEQEGELAGLLHDIGKYGDKFQRRLLGLETGLDHWSQGAYLALAECKSIAAAVAIQGHHIGLQSLLKEELSKLKPHKLKEHHPLGLALSETNISVLKNRLNSDGLITSKPDKRLFEKVLSESEARIDTMLDVRRMFSALVDADFLDTEAHFNGSSCEIKRYRQPGLMLNKNHLASRALEILKDHVENIAREKTYALDDLRSIRNNLYECCLKSSQQKNNIFTLTAPTGSGKTLSMLAFALNHAIFNNLQRIILVVPYLNIIEQTVKTYRNVFSELDDEFDSEFILEHHSMADLGLESTTTDSERLDTRSSSNSGAENNHILLRKRLLSENWDAPIVVTTNVQFFESLFSNRPSACRKIHRIANSVVLFDEIQTLPTKLAIPSLASISHIATNWNSSIIFATATQPAFHHLHDEVAKQCNSGWNPKEIVHSIDKKLKCNNSVTFEWMNSKVEWSQLALDISKLDQVLCVVNLKRHALSLWQELENINQTNDTFYLSTNLCPMHRTKVVDEIRNRLANGKRCRLISTQCIEAGVDLDFPVVFRALAPLDAIVQAAGRCNRERNIRCGHVVIFEPSDENHPYPSFDYKQATTVTKQLQNKYGEIDVYNSDIIQEYYKILYDISAPDQQNQDLDRAIQDLDFRSAAKYYKLINNNTINVVVCFDEDYFSKLKEQVEEHGVTVRWIKNAVRSSICLFRPNSDDVVWDAFYEAKQPATINRFNITQDWYFLADLSDYHNILGFQKPDSLKCWIG